MASSIRVPMIDWRLWRWRFCSRSRRMGSPHREQQLIQSTPEIARALVALRRIFSERLHQDALELRRNGAIDFADRGHTRGLHHAHGLEIRLAHEQATARQELPQDDADGENVGAAVHRPALGGLG
jgi:hypothetical protein